MFLNLLSYEFSIRNIRIVHIHVFCKIFYSKLIGYLQQTMVFYFQDYDFGDLKEDRVFILI